MLDGILARGFSSKCKSSIKDTRARIEVVRRRADAKQRFLKEDLAKLLANGLDINAYGRTEEFLAGVDLLSCYDFIELACEYILNNLSSMQKQRECPEECREPVASLMFAAARFSDLPELRDLRDLFQERYGSHLDCFVDQQLVEKLSSRPQVTEKRFQLLQDIASEFSISWDSRGFEQRMSAPFTPAQEQPTKYGFSNVAADKCNLHDSNGSPAKSDKFGRLPKQTPAVSTNDHGMQNRREGNDLRKDELDNHFYGKQERSSKGESTRSKGENDILFHGRQEASAGKHEALSKKDVTLSKAVKSGSSSLGKQLDCAHNGCTDQDDGIDDMHKLGSWETSSHGKVKPSPSCGVHPGKNKDISTTYEKVEKQNEANSTRKVQEKEIGSLNSYHNNLLPPPYVKSKEKVIPPPYVKPKESKHKASRMSEHAGSCGDERSMDSSPCSSVNEVSKSNWTQKESGNPVHEGENVGSTRLRSHEIEQFYRDEKVPLPRPKSLRRKQHKSSSKYDESSNVEDIAVKRSSSSRRRDCSRKGLHILFDDEHHNKDEEERLIDKLLLHYSKKPSTYDAGRPRKNSQARPSRHIASDTGESSHDQSRDGDDVEIVPLPTRSLSLPHQQTVPSEAKKIFTRANSFQPDIQARHVHPKLPDYDDLAARFAALKGQ